MSDLDTEIREALERVTSPVGGGGGLTFEHLVARRRRRRTHRAALGVFTGVLLLGLTLVGLPFVVGGSDDTRVTTGEPALADEPMIEEKGESPDSNPALVGESLVIWLEVGATPPQVAVIAETLQSLPEVSAIRFIGPEETWREFSEYYADQPEMIELVEQDQLPTSFQVTSSAPTVVAEAVESLPGVDAVDIEDRGPTVGSNEEPVDPVGDLGLLASATGATTIVFGGPEEPIESWDNHLLVWQGETTTRIGPFSNPWISNQFVIDRASDSGPTRIYDLAGRMVCELRLPDLANVHHVTTRADDTVVLGIEQGIDDEADYRTEAFAYDCQTGDRIPIEPFTVHFGDGEWVRIERIGDRIFEVHGDAEGNVDPILNEDGVDIVGDDWAGQLAWSADGSVLAYGNHRNSASAHVTNQLVVRDTRTGQLLWATELPQVISRLVITGDRLVVGLGEDQGGWVPTERAAVYDLRLGEDAGQVLVIDNAPPGLIYLD